MGITSERNNQIIIELLKHHRIKRVIASPGATNVSFIASIQNDPFFEVYSCVDERSAAYIACGIAAETNEAVVLSCTGATASRNYYPGLTEAYYRHLPVLALTSTMPLHRLGHNIPQVIDRRDPVSDIAKLCVHIPLVKDEEDEWMCAVRANEAMLELTHHVPGPVHMNVETAQSGTFDVQSIKKVQLIDRIMPGDEMPEIRAKTIAIFCGAHTAWSSSLTEAVDSFCRKYGAVVIGDHTSNYKGEYGVNACLVTLQENELTQCNNIDLLIHIGDISGAYLKLHPKEVWRVAPDGHICDTYRKLRYAFEFEEQSFFSRYVSMGSVGASDDMTFRTEWNNAYERLKEQIPELPLSNLWLASRISYRLPENSVVHLGILNSLRSWNFFDISKTIFVYSNTGGFGIDGCVSSLIGAALMSPEKIFFGIVGDLAFFYDMNALGNRHIPNNIRLLIINNGHGQEFRNYKHRAAQFEEDTDRFIAAAGHYGNKSESLVKNYTISLGFQYYSADSKENAEKLFTVITSKEAYDSPIVFELFTDNDNETEALRQIVTLNGKSGIKAKDVVKNMIGENGVATLKGFFKKNKEKL